MAPPDSIIVILWAALIFAAISSIGFVALAWRFFQRTLLSLPIRSIVTAIVVGLLATSGFVLITTGEQLSAALLLIAVGAGVLVCVTWIIIWLGQAV